MGAKLVRLISVGVTLAVLAVAVLLAARLWREYDAHPWTRDAEVRAQVVSVAPQVKGPVARINQQKDMRVLAQGADHLENVQTGSVRYRS